MNGDSQVIDVSHFNVFRDREELYTTTDPHWIYFASSQPAEYRKNPVMLDAFEKCYGVVPRYILEQTGKVPEHVDKNYVIGGGPFGGKPAPRPEPPPPAYFPTPGELMILKRLDAIIKFLGVPAL